MNKKVLIKILPVFGGALLGYLYYYFIGCNNNCTIQSNPLYSTLYGAMMGLVWVIPFSFPRKNKEKKKD